MASSIDDDDDDDETRRFLDDHTSPGHGSTSSESTQDDEEMIDIVPSDYDFSVVCRLLYISHFLSTWNSRVFEFGAVLFLIYIYPNTLLPVSVYALARAASAAVLSPWIGTLIDRKNRLHVIRLSIVSQRIAVGASCVILFFMATLPSFFERKALSIACLAIISVLACIEKLGSVMNTISVERDWVVVIAMGNEGKLSGLNSRMRRIDLFCKLAGPLVIAFIDSASTKVAIVVTGSMTIISVLVEYFAIARVYRKVPALAGSKDVPITAARSSGGPWSRVKRGLSDTGVYCRHPVFLPSFSLALLYLTVLSFSGQMVTYLAVLGLESSLIGILRGVSTVFELSATWLAPAVVGRIGSIRSGIWFINWQVLCVAACTAFLWVNVESKFRIVGTVALVIASRIGLWGFDLSVQNIVQEEVEAHLRGTFSSQEFALQNIFEMLAFASTVVFSRPDQFKIPATISAGAVGIAGALFAVFVRGRRGHLVHLSRCIDPNGHKRKDHHHWWMGPERNLVSSDRDDVEEGPETDSSRFEMM